MGKVKLDPGVFDVEIKEHLVQKYVVYQLAKKRIGSAATKQNKGELHGSGKSLGGRRVLVGLVLVILDLPFGEVV